MMSFHPEFFILLQGQCGFQTKTHFFSLKTYSARLERCEVSPKKVKKGVGGSLLDLLDSNAKVTVVPGPT